MLSTYNFDNMSNVNNDKLYVTQKSIQDKSICQYQMQNFRDNNVYMNIATSQAGIQFKGGHGMSHDGKNINDSSKLLLKSIPGGKADGPIDLWQRPFLTVPYVGRGTVDPTMEMEMKKGLLYSNRKMNTSTSENNHTTYIYTPLLNEIESQLQNPSRYDQQHCCGQPSRELQRDTVAYKR